MTALPQQLCLACGDVLQATSEVTTSKARMPEPGNLSICLRCGHVAIFDKDLKLRNPTPEEQRKIDNDPRMPRIQRHRAAVMAGVPPRKQTEQ